MKDLLLVAGSTRCGMSMTMQMLAAGGCAVFGTGPAYEDFEPFIFPPGARNCAVKILDPLRWTLPLERVAGVVYCRRDPMTQARSQLRFLGALTGLELPEQPPPELVASINRDDEQAIEMFCRAGIRTYVQRFEYVIEHPGFMAGVLASFVYEFTGGRTICDPDNMRRAVVDREPDLHPTLLELEMLRGKEPKPC